MSNSRILQNTPISTLFSSPHDGKIQVTGKILRKISNVTFILADAGAFCELKVETEDVTVRSRQLKQMNEGECVILVNPKIQNGNSLSITTETSIIEEDEDIHVDFKVCEGCNKVTDGNSLLKHVSHTRQCKVVYGDRYIKMLQESRKSTKKKYNSEHASEINKANKKYHKDNRENILERKKKSHQKKKEIEEQEIQQMIADRGPPKPYERPRPLTSSILPYAIIKVFEECFEVENDTKNSNDKSYLPTKGKIFHYKCDRDLGKYFITKESFDKHVEKCQETAKKLEGNKWTSHTCWPGDGFKGWTNCDHCGQRISTESFIQHLEKEHTVTKRDYYEYVDKSQAVCEECGEIFDTDSILKHISNVQKCTDFYKERLPGMKKLRRKQVKAKNYDKYDYSPYYQKNKETILAKRKKKREDEKKAWWDEKQRKCEETYPPLLEKRKVETPKEARRQNLEGKSRLNESLEAIENLRKNHKLDEKNQKVIKDIESKVENLYQTLEARIQKGSEKIKDLKCKPRFVQTKNDGRRVVGSGLDEIDKIFGGELDYMNMKKTWSNMEDVAIVAIRKVYLELELNCFLCDNQKSICWRCKMRDRKDVEAIRAKVAKKKELINASRENKNYVRKRKPIDFTMEEMENEADDCTDEDDYKPPQKPKSRRLI